MPEDFEIVEALANGGNGELFVGKINNADFRKRAGNDTQCVIKLLIQRTLYPVHIFML